MTDIQTNQDHRQTDRLTIIRVSRQQQQVLHLTKDRDTQTTQHAAISAIAVRRNTAWDALDPRNVYLNITYFKISHRMCNLVAKIVDYIVRCQLRHGQTDRQRDGRTDGRHNNRVKNHEADGVKRSISLTTLDKQYNLILLVWEGNRGSNPIMNRNCLLYTSPSPRDGLLSRMPSSA